MKSNRQDDIISLLLEHSEQQGKNLTTFTTDDRESLRKVIFLNPHTFQLTIKGLNILSEFFEPFSVPLPDEHQLTSKKLIILDRETKAPYYYSKNHRLYQQSTTLLGMLVLFEQDLAVLLKLCDGDIDMVEGIYGSEISKKISDRLS